ncbi:MAG TPA: cyclic nucleotide-binding protein [Alphaproteobacteria bacterium]|nr:cyclic nucleotide-binding protein [Alphaproteobacteria bacterium]HAJ48177.1 cyclic nucleotide-binding protein [Alphaproteobacteria bacterium]
MAFASTTSLDRPPSHLRARDTDDRVNPVYEALVCGNCPARQSDLCGELKDPELQDLSRYSLRATFREGETVIWEGDPATHAGIVTRGCLRMTRTGADGRRQILGFLFSGDIVSLPATSHYTVSLEALANGELCRFERSRLEAALHKYPNLERGYRRTVATALEGAYGLAYSLGRKTAMERVATFLSDLRSGSCPKSPGGIMHLPMTRTDIADFLGLTVETVSRMFTKLKGAKVIRLPNAQEVEIVDPARLASLAESGNET